MGFRFDLAAKWCETLPPCYALYAELICVAFVCSAIPKVDTLTILLAWKILTFLTKLASSGQANCAALAKPSLTILLAHGT